MCEKYFYCEKVYTDASGNSVAKRHDVYDVVNFKKYKICSDFLLFHHNQTLRACVMKALSRDLSLQVLVKVKTPLISHKLEPKHKSNGYYFVCIVIYYIFILLYPGSSVVGEMWWRIVWRCSFTSQVNKWLNNIFLTTVL